MKFATRLVDYDAAPGDLNRPMATPIYQTSTFAQEKADSFGPYDYTRSGNPTRRVLEDHLADLENGKRGFVFSSGMTAITTVGRLLCAGDEIVADWDLYGGACRFFSQVLDRSGVVVRYADASNPELFAQSCGPNTKMVYVESPTNPLLHVIDLKVMAALAHQRGALFCVDNSSMSPYLQNPLDLGADIVLHSATKYLGGHSDVTGGAIVVKDDALAKDIYFLQNAEGSALGPFDCFLLLRGLKTLKLRLDAQQGSAAAIARFLQNHPHVRHVYYPGLATSQGYSVQQQQARGAGGVLSFTTGSFDRSRRIAEASHLFHISVSFGSVHSTISLPGSMSHASVPAELKAIRALPPDLVRVSVGIEDQEDLLDDLSRAIDIACEGQQDEKTDKTDSVRVE
ncbi:MAG TPA: PLP-dependent aspartate aminotransferase family protein [Acidisarcina sp.]|nr:PLP-dependent aspartate aminotransferase family protein [Acidisarcina sp.]